MADDRTPESYIVLGGVRSPGVIPPGGITGHDREKNWQVQNAKGQHGASMTLDGDNPGQFQITFYLTDEEPESGDPSDLALWDDFQKLIESTTPKGGKPSALPIEHPDLARNHFTSVVEGMVGGCIHDGKGGRTYQVKFREFIPPKPKPVQKPAPASSSSYAADSANDVQGTGTRDNDPNQAAKDQLAELTNQAQQP